MNLRPSSLPVLVQVAALAALAVVMSQVVTFAVILLAPEPRPAGFSVAAAAEALAGRPARTIDGRPLRRRIAVQPVQASADPLSRTIAAVLTERTGAAPGELRVAIRRERPDRNLAPRLLPPTPTPTPTPGEKGHGGVSSFVLVREEALVAPARTAPPPPLLPPGADAASGATPSPGAPTRIEIVGGTQMRLRRGPGAPAAPSLDATPEGLNLLADRLTFAPFSASMRLPDGRWAVVEPPRGLLAPWQTRILISLLISAVLLAPLVWWMARRLTRPIRVFAHAAERLGADPEAEPLAASGPREVRTAISAFNDMQASLRRHMRQRTQTVAAIAHDLRTPLTRLRFRAEQAPPVAAQRMAADIEEMDALIAQAMAYVRGEQPPQRRERFDLSGLAADGAAGFAETGAPVSFAGEDPLPVMGDPASLRRALANLIENAVKYGGAAQVRAFAEAGRATVLVEDRGPGLADDELETVFEPFRRGERSRSRETGGAGLGLTVARQAARAHGGDVTLANRPEGGLSARLNLPLMMETD